MTTTDKQPEELNGRELDAWIAEHVMGWTWWSTKLRNSEEMRRSLWHPGFKNDEWILSDQSEEPFEGDNPWVPRFSEAIAAAMQVIEKMRECGIWVEIYTFLSRPIVVEFVNENGLQGKAETGSLGDLPLAICRAAREAVRNRNGESDGK